MPYKVEDSEVVHCLECGDTISYGRKDRLFCCAECKNRYNNRKIRRSRAIRRKIQVILLRNYEVLDGLLKLQINAMGLYDLSLMGFRREYSTAYRKCGCHCEYHCYDIKYFLTTNRIFGICRDMSMIPEEPLEGGE